MYLLKYKDLDTICLPNCEGAANNYLKDNN